MDERLNDIFSNINEWLKFAEAKTAVLIAGNGALIFGVARIAKAYDVNGFFAMYALLFFVLCVGSLLFCFISLIPSLSMPWESKPGSISESDNIFYFADVAKYTPVAYINKINKNIGGETDIYTEFQKDLASQIITNSVIALRKYNYFNLSIWLTLSAIITPVGTMLLLMIRSSNK